MFGKKSLRFEEKVHFDYEDKSLEEMLFDLALTNGLAKMELVKYVQEAKIRKVDYYGNEIIASPKIPLFLPYSPLKELKPTDLVANSSEEIRKAVSSLNKRSEEVIGLSSKVTSEMGNIWHLQFLDIDFPERTEIEEKIQKTKTAIKKSGIKRGYVINSGEGHHVYGQYALSESNWERWIATMKKNGGVDGLWAQTQIGRGYSVLRLTSSTIKTHAPKVLYKFSVD